MLLLETCLIVGNVNAKDTYINRESETEQGAMNDECVVRESQNFKKKVNSMQKTCDLGPVFSIPDTHRTTHNPWLRQ